MKILIVGFAKIKYMPYLNLYLENIDRKKNDVHLLYWNRDLIDEDTSKMENLTLHEFRCFQEDEVSKLSKIKSFELFGQFARRVMKEKFDFVIVMHSLPGVILHHQLIKSFKNRYIFDYRDFTYEDIKPYKLIIHSLVNNSYKTFVSSDAFRKYLPEKGDKILTSHNVVPSDIRASQNEEKIECDSSRIRVGFWGFIRQEDLNRKIIEKFSQDNRFELHYYGREQQTARDLKVYVKDNGIQNVFFHGEYNPNDKVNIVRNTDIIHNIYDDKATRLAMGNKYYDGVVFKKPQICMEGSFMGACAEESGVGYQANPYSNRFTQDIYEYFSNLDTAEFSGSCEAEKKRILEENKKITETIKSI